MTKAERFRNSVQNVEMSDELLLAEARKASGQVPDVYHSLRTEGGGEWHFGFDDGSVLALHIIEPNLPFMRYLSA